MSRLTNRENWHERHIPRLGARVYDVHDERHVGRLDAVLWSTTAIIRWDDGWRSDIPVRRVRLAPREG